MRRTLLASIVATLLLTPGCSSGQYPSSALPSQPETASGQQAATVPALRQSRRMLYVAGGINAPGWVTIYRQGGNDQHKIGQITDGVDGPICTAVDDAENLYVGNYGSGTVTVYPPGQTSPSLTLKDAGKPVGITVGRDGTVYVSDQGTGKVPPSGASILEYARGRTRPSVTIALLDGEFPIGMALDSSGNLYAAIDRFSPDGLRERGDVYKVAPGSKTWIDLGIALGALGQMAIDKQNDLLIVDEKSNTVDVFRPGKKRPSAKIGGFPQASIFGVAINKENTEIWVTDGFWGHVFGVSYPAGQIVDEIARPRGLAMGVAVSPATGPLSAAVNRALRAAKRGSPLCLGRRRPESSPARSANGSGGRAVRDSASLSASSRRRTRCVGYD